MTDSLRIGIVGCGGISRKHAAAYQTLGGARIAWVYDVVKAAAHKLAEETGAHIAASIERMASKSSLDAVSICTPPGLHLDHALPFLRAGVPVLCEKPLEASLACAEALAEAVRQTGTAFMTAFCHRFHGPILELASLTRSGKLGRPQFFRNMFGGFIDLKGNSRADPCLSGGGALIDNGSHGIDLFRHLLGEPTHVQAMAGKVAQDLPIEDFSMIHLRIAGDAGRPSDAFGEIVSHYSVRFTGNWVEWHGSQGSAIVAYWSPGVPELRYRLEGDADWTAVDCSHHPDRFPAQINHFIDCVRSGTAPRVSVDDGVRAARIVDAAYRSIRGGRLEPIAHEPVDLPRAATSI